MIDNVGLRRRLVVGCRLYRPRWIVVSAPTPPDFVMTPQERRSTASLALIFALRMLGLFLVLPVFALEAHRYPGGDDAALVGLAMGVYGLTQGLLQIPFGLASDKWGRKPLMVLGLLIFAAGSAIAACAPSVQWLVAGRAIQGAGAISAAITALLADQTRDDVRTKAMALVGASIGLMFALSLVAAPWLAAHLGLHGLFAMTAALAVGGIAVVVWWVPPEQGVRVDAARGGLRAVLRHPALLRLNLGVFVLHAVQLSMWMALPAMLVQAGLPRAQHWQVYLPAVLASFGVMGATLFPLEKKGYLRAVFLSAIALIAGVQVALGAMAHAVPGVWPLALVLWVFFCGFNVLEASQPSLVSRVAPVASRGAALGVYNTLQSLGFFAGGAMGGWLVKSAGAPTLFFTSAVAMLAWFWLAWGMDAPAPRGAPKAG